MSVLQRKTISIILLFVVSTMLTGIFVSCSNIYDDPSLSEIMLSDSNLNGTDFPEVSTFVDERIDTEIPNDSSEYPSTYSDTNPVEIETTVSSQPTQSESDVTIQDEYTSEIFTETESETIYSPPILNFTVPKEITNAIIDAAINTKKFGSDNVDDYTIRCFGIFGDVYAVFVDSNAVVYPDMEFEEEIAGLVFKYGSTQTLMIFCNSNLYRINEAYKNSIIDLNSLRILYETYSSVKRFYYVSE